MDWLKNVFSLVGAWLLDHSPGIIFTAGLASITVGFALFDVALAFIVPGAIVCTLTAVPQLVSFFRGGN